MASPLLDFKKFKHVKSDAKSTTLQHKDGHTLTINHNALSKANQEQLKALSKVASETATPDQKQEADPHYGKTAVKDPADQLIGKVIKKAEGGIVPEPDDEDKDKQIAADEVIPDKGYGKIIIKSAEGGQVPCPHCGGGAVKKMASGGAPEDNSVMADPVQTSQYGVNAPIPGANEPQVDPELAHKRELYNKAVQGTSGYSEYGTGDEMSQYKFGPQGEEPKQFDPSAWKVAEKRNEGEKQSVAKEGMDKQAAIASENEQRMKAGLTPLPMPGQAPAQAPGQQPEAQTPTETAPDATQQPSSPQAPAAQQYTPTVQKDAGGPMGMPSSLRSEDAAWQNDLQNGHITPKTYESMFADKGTLGRLGMMFGLMVSGAGAGVTGQPNMLMEMMNKEIERDLDAQQKSKTNAINFHTLANQHAMNQANIGHLHMQDAQIQRELSTQTMWRSALDKAWREIQKMPDPVKKQQAIQAYGYMSQGVDAKLQNAEASIASKQQLAQSMIGGSQGAGEEGFQQQQKLLRMMGQAPLATSNEEHHISGVPEVAGQTTERVIPDKAREKITAMNVLDNKGKELINFVEKNRGTWNPRVQAVADQKMEEMKNFYNNSIEGGALTEGRLDWYDKQFRKDPTGRISYLLGSEDKLKEMITSNASRKNQELVSLGFKPKASAGQEVRYDSKGQGWTKGPNGTIVKVK